MTPAERLAQIALGEVGAREIGKNGGPRVRAYQSATWLDPDDWPWCAAFCCWAIKEWLKSQDVLAALNMSAERARDWRPQTPAAFKLIKWAQRNGLQVLPETAAEKTGDIVVFDFSHCGIVYAPGSATVYTVEGNTNASGDREGDGVWKKVRPRHLVQKFIRLVP